MFNASSLSVLTYAQGFTHWHYRARVQVFANGQFFQPLTVTDIIRVLDSCPVDLFVPGDLITIQGKDGTALRYFTPNMTLEPLL